MALLDQRHSKLDNEPEQPRETKDSSKMPESQEEDPEQWEVGEGATYSGTHTCQLLETKF